MNVAHDASSEPSFSLREVAKAYAQRNYRVFPLHSVTSGCSCKRQRCSEPGNHPRLDDWAAQATSNVVAVEKWWKRWPTANIGLVVSADGRFVRVDPTQPLPLDGEPATIYLPSSKVFQGMQRALVSPKGWHFAADDVPYYVDEATDLVYSYGGHRGPEVSAAAVDAANRTLQENISVLDPPTSIVFIVSMAKWIAARRNGTLSESLSVTIHVDEILELMGRKKHKNRGYKIEQKRDISNRFQKLDAFMVSGVNPNPLEQTKKLRGSILDVAFKEDFDLLGSATPYEFRVKPGEAVWETIVSSTVELTDFFVSLAQLDFTRKADERMAFLIGVYVVFQYRIRESTENYEQPWRVATILERARIPIEQDARHYKRFREQVDAALDRLKHDGVFGDWQYVDGDEESLPTRGWFKPWLQTRIRITPPAIVRERARLRATSKRERERVAGNRSRKQERA